MEKFFNTAGPCIPEKHYMLPALDRLPGIRRLVSMERYFVIHAPRQTGKTTALNALVDEIKAGRLRSETPEGNLAVDDMLYMGIELADKTVVYRDFNAEELKRTLGITSICLTREQASTANPQEQMRRAVDKVTLMDDSLNECDPDNIPEGFCPTSIAIHIGNQLE